MEKNFYENELDSLSELIGILRKHIPLLIVCAFLVLIPFVGKVIINLKANTPQYLATTSIVVDSITHQQKSDNGQSTVAHGIGTEIQILKSRKVVSSALSLLDLDEYHFSEDNFAATHTLDDEHIENIQNSITTTIEKDSNVCTITFSHSNELFARDFLSSVLISYNKHLVEFSAELSHNNIMALSEKLIIAEQYLDDKRNMLKAKIEKSERLRDLEPMLSGYSFVYDLPVFESIESFKLALAEVENIRMEKTAQEIFNSIPKKVIYQVNEVETDVLPTNKHNIFLILLGFLLSASLAPVAVLIFEYFSNTIEDQQSLGKLLSKTSLFVGAIPRLKKSTDPMVEIIRFPKSRFSISYDRIASLLSANQSNHVYAITGIGEKESRANLVMCIAITFIQNGKNVHVIDASDSKFNYQNCINLLKNVENDFGEILLQKFDQKQSISYNNVESSSLVITVMDSNEIPHALRNGIFASYIESVKSIYDVILINSPSTDRLQILSSISKISDSIIMHVEANSDKRRQIKPILQNSNFCDIALQGVILSNIKRPFVVYSG